jgi:post-segregation antitoxin (ccd killing protein)
MDHPGKTPVPKQSMSVPSDRGPLDETPELGLSLSRAAEAAIHAERARGWQQENDAAIADYNAFVENEGVLLAEFLKF